MVRTYTQTQSKSDWLSELAEQSADQQRRREVEQAERRGANTRTSSLHDSRPVLRIQNQQGDYQSVETGDATYGQEDFFWGRRSGGGGGAPLRDAQGQVQTSRVPPAGAAPIQRGTTQPVHNTPAQPSDYRPGRRRVVPSSDIDRKVADAEWRAALQEQIEEKRRLGSVVEETCSKGSVIADNQTRNSNSRRHRESLHMNSSGGLSTEVPKNGDRRNIEEYGGQSTRTSISSACTSSPSRLPRAQNSKAGTLRDTLDTIQKEVGQLLNMKPRVPVTGSSVSSKPGPQVQREPKSSQDPHVSLVRHETDADSHPGLNVVKAAHLKYIQTRIKTPTIQGVLPPELIDTMENSKNVHNLSEDASRTIAEAGIYRDKHDSKLTRPKAVVRRRAVERSIEDEMPRTPEELPPIKRLVQASRVQPQQMPRASKRDPASKVTPVQERARRKVAAAPKPKKLRQHGYATGTEPPDYSKRNDDKDLQTALQLLLSFSTRLSEERCKVSRELRESSTNDRRS
ncbi:hypothetical protein BC832DRAFT_126569 [Gaertneriomyces semiglobifer]|nr:hypothetical protein BC832DRAFT_126569 [Gaertneriomyces semiglobifer]